MKKATYGGIGVVSVLAVVNVGIHMSHEHHAHSGPGGYSYMHVRTKGFPWDESKCDLFDLDCKRAYRASKQ